MGFYSRLSLFLSLPLSLFLYLSACLWVCLLPSSPCSRVTVSSGFRGVFRIRRPDRYRSTQLCERANHLSATHLWLNWYPGSEHALFTPVFLSMTSVYTTAVESAKPTVVSTTEAVFGTAGTANDVPLVVITACTAVLLLTTCCTTVSFSRLKSEKPTDLRLKVWNSCKRWNIVRSSRTQTLRE